MFISFENFMGDRDDLDEVNLIGPFEDAAARARELARLSGLPLGVPELNGGYRFSADRVTAAGADRVVEPATVAGATTIHEFFAAFFGWSADDPTPAGDVHRDQLTVDGIWQQVTA